MCTPYHGTGSRTRGPHLETSQTRPSKRTTSQAMDSTAPGISGVASMDVAMAHAVGARRGAPVVLTVDAAGPHAQGHVFHLAASGIC